MALVMRKCVDSTTGGDFARVEHELQGKKAYCFVVSREDGLAASCMTNAQYVHCLTLVRMRHLGLCTSRWVSL